MSEEPLIVAEQIIDTRVPRLKHALEQSGVRRRWIGRVSLLCGTVAATLAAVLAVALADYLLVVPWMVRLGLMLAVGAGAIWGLVRLVRKWNAFGSAIEVARAIESVDGRFGCILSTAIEYGKFDPTAFGEYEAELVDALLVQASAQTAAVQPDVKRSLRKPVAIALLAAGLALVFILVLPDGTTAVRRAVAPWTPAAYTNMTVTPGTADIPEGRDVEVAVTFAGRLPKEAAISYQEGSGNWTTVPLKRVGTGRYTHSFPAIRGTIRYTIVARKVESPTFTLEAFRAPEIKAWHVRLKYPKYTQLPDRVQTLPDVSTVRGTKIAYRVEIQEEVRKLELDVAGKSKLDVMPEPGTWGMAELEAKESGPIWLEITDLKGRLTRSAVPYQLVVLPDAAPKVMIAKPGRNVRVRATEKVAIEVNAEDDFGLASLVLTYKKLGEEAGIDVPLEPQPAGPGKYTAKYEFDVTKLGFKVGDVVVYHAAATDRNDIDGPGRAKSKAFFIEVTPPPRNADEQQQEQQQNNQNQQQQRQQIDLYELQKQMLQMTLAVEEGAGKDDLAALGDDQTKVYELGAVFRQMLEAEGIKDAKLLGMLEEARDAMKSAAASLHAAEQPAAIRHEEVAVKKLAELMAIIRPEILQKINRQLRQEIVKREAEEEKRQQEQIPEMLRQVNQLAQQQTQLNQQQEQQPQEQQQQEQTPEQQQEQQQEQQEDAQGEQDPQQREQAQRQQEIAAKAQEIEERARRMGIAQPADRLDEAQAKMNLKQGGASLEKLMDAAEALRLLQGRGIPDLAAESYPGEYENMISSYFRKLSKEE